MSLSLYGRVEKPGLWSDTAKRTRDELCWLLRTTYRLSKSDIPPLVAADLDIFHELKW